jgi:uncharacterized protein YlxW (UPF0749 family)
MMVGGVDVGTFNSNVTVFSSNVVVNRLGVGTSTPEYPIHVTTHVNNASIYAAFDVAAFSDARVKTDLRRIEGALGKVAQLAGYTYLRTDDGSCDIRQCGVIAQEVVKVLPEAVHVHPESGMMSVAYGNMASLLIEAIKELRAENQTLSARVADLEAR